MKIALVHDYIKEYGGAERVLEALHELFPDAPVYTSIYLPLYLGPHKGRFRNWKIKTSFLEFIPFVDKLISPLRLLAPVAFELFDLSQFDVIIVSATGAYAPNLIKKGKAFQICYYHTPPRYLYGYATAREWKKNIFFRILGEIANVFLRMIDYKSSKQVDLAIANSQNVRRRIQKFYKKDAMVIYPPVEVYSEFKVQSLHTKKKDYFLAGGRLARPKHIDLIVQTCTKLSIPLKIFGKEFAGYGQELKQLAGSTVEFVGEVTDDEKFALMHNAKAFIFAGEEEDFGITPVEAMAVGTPVIAYHSGGVLETIIDGKTGNFFDKLTIESLSIAIEEFNALKLNPKDCISHAEKFSKERFQNEIRHVIDTRLHTQESN